MKIGFLSSLSLLLPFLGRSFGLVVGIHPRMISYGALAIILALVWNVPEVRAHRRISRGTRRVQIAVALLILLVLIAYPWGDPFWVTGEEPTLAEYPGSKITDFLTISVPFLILGWVVHPYARRKEFLDGLAAGSMFVGGLGAWQVLRFRNLLGDFNEFANVGFGTISLSLVFLFVIVGASRWVQAEESKHRFYLFLAVSAAALWGIFLTAQRTSMLLGFAFVIFISARFIIRRRTVLIVLAMVVAVASLAGSLVEGSDGFDLTDELPAQTARFSSVFTREDASTRARLEMWTFALDKSLNRPFGHGFVSFAEEYPGLRYPHNLPLEASYELGLLGGGIVLFLIGLSAGAGRRLLRIEGGEFYLLALVASLAMTLKASDFSTMGFWLFWLLVAISATDSRLAGRTAVLAQFRQSRSK